MPEPPLDPRPLLFASDSITEGYYELEAAEKSETMQALSTHREEVYLWYAGLTLYRRGLLSRWSFLGNDDRLRAWNLQGQLLGLGVSSAKVGLDTLLAGYYSMSFAATRHLLETCAQIDYLERFPDEAPLWHGEAGGRAKRSAKLSSNELASYEPAGMYQLLLPLEDNDQDRVKRNQLYRSWKLMCKGAHPSGEGVRQTESVDQNALIFGPTYHPELCSAGFDHGLFSVLEAIKRLHVIQNQSEEWQEDVVRLRHSLQEWRKRQQTNFDPDGQWIGPGPIARIDGPV